ncbi:hypothetical protein GCM10009422_28130 [Brevundimonas kwangchunensis]|uniref:Uncharacterized protein n=1 Tax=Brevundimonas kwangchunensis TaxID=322163 RepID=A0ABN1H572_9CAUL
MGATDFDPNYAKAPRRIRNLLPTSPGVSAERTTWQAGDTFATARPEDALTTQVAEALRAHDLELDGALILVRHRSGERGLPVSDSAAAFRFAIDLSDSPRPLNGGLLMFVSEDGRTHGWRAEIGALTVWNGEDPELTELAPGAPDRLTLVGQANPLPALP